MQTKSGPISKLKEIPDKFLFGRLNLPSNAKKVILKTEKTIRMIGGTPTLQPDGIWAYRQNGKLTCVAFQAEDSTGKNVSSLLGKALLCQLCGDDYSLIRVDETIRDDDGRPTTKTRPARVDRLVVVFFYNADIPSVSACVEGVINCLNPVTHFASNVFSLPIDMKDIDAAVMPLQNIIYELLEI